MRTGRPGLWIAAALCLAHTSGARAQAADSARAAAPGGRAGADSTGASVPSVAPRARYIALAKLDGVRLPEGDPWAPDRPAFLLVKRDGLYVFEANKPNDPPRRLLQAQVMQACWSPDGTWIGCRVRVPTAVRGGAVRLQFVAAAGGPSEYRIPRARIGPFLWAEDGAVYFWDAQSGARSRLEPPRSWRDRRPQLPEARPPHLLLVAGPEKRRPHVIRFTPAAPGRQPEERQVEALQPPQATNVAIAAAFPNASPATSRFVVRMQVGSAGVRTYVVNQDGERLARLGDAEDLPAFIGTSVSADGRYVIGQRAQQGAGTLLSSELWLADAAGAWCTRIEAARNAGAPRLSHAALFIVSEDPTSNGDAVLVGRLDIKPR